MNYIGRKSCGCIVVAIADVPEMKQEIVKELPLWIKRGYTIERVSTEYVKEHLRGCKCNRQQKALTEEKTS